MAAPVSFSFAGRWTVMVGRLTLVTSRVGSVTSTSFRVSFGDMRTFSGPMSPVSSGTLPGHSSTTVGGSAPAAGRATHHQAISDTAPTVRVMVAAPLSESGENGVNKPVWEHDAAASLSIHRRDTASAAGYVTRQPPGRRQGGYRATSFSG